MGYRIINGQAFPVGNIGGTNNSNNVSIRNTSQKTTNFKDILQKEIREKESYIVSKHAKERLQNVNFTESDMKEIEKGFQIAENKGCKNSLMIYKDVAIIASIENKTVITAVEKERAKENIFTNIDSVVML